MNHTYRLVFSTKLKMFVVASELVRSRGKNSSVGTGERALSPVSSAMRFLKRHAAGLRLGLLAGLVAAQFAPGAAMAHTISIGYENSGMNALTFWYGTYHTTSEAPNNEGSMTLLGPNGFNVTLPYNLFAEVKPSGLVDGSTNFYSTGSYGLMSYNVNGQPVQNWQGLQFTNLAAGTYTFTYDPIANPTQKWAPINSAILSSSVTVITADLNNQAPRVGLGQVVDQTQVSDPIIFEGGTVRTTAPTVFNQVVSVDNPGGTFDTNGHDSTLTGNIDGRGTLTKTGDGTLTLRGTNTNTGGTAINGGVLNIDADSRLGAPSGGVSFNGGTLQWANNFNLDPSRAITMNAGGGTLDTNNHDTTISQGIGGVGGLTKTGGGTLNLTGTNTFAGGLNIAGGTLQAASDANLGTGAVTIGNGTLQATGNLNTDNAVALTSGNATIDTQNNAVTVSGPVSGNGSLNKNGAGTLTLTGADTYTGATVINAGTLALAGNGSIAASSGVANNGTLDISARNTDATITSISGNGNVNLGSKNLNLSNAAGTLGGAINGSGGLNVTGGGETLTGANGYTGATTIGTGATLALAGNGSIAASSGVANSGNLDISGTTAGATLNTLSGSGNVNLGGKDLTLSNASGTFAGGINGAGGLHVNGGIETLSGNSTYTGGTSIGNATVRIGSDSGLGAATGALALNNGALQTTASLVTSRDTTINGGGHFVTDAGTTLADNGGVSGAGTLVKDGAGTMVLNGVASHTGGTVVNNGVLALNADNTYTGGNVVNNGATLQVAKDAALGDGSNNVMLNGGTLQATGSFSTARDMAITGTAHINSGTGATFTDSGDISGSGTLVKDGAGTMVLNGTASHGGGTVVNGGVLALNGDNTYTGGNVVNNGATLQVAKDAALGDASNGVALNNGTLQAGGSFATARNIAINGVGAISTDAGATMTGNGNVTGNGTLVKDGAGTLEIAGVASHTGGTFVNGGTLILDGDNTYTGGNLVGNSATLQVAKDAALGDASNGVALNGGTLHATGSFNTARNIALAGSGIIGTDAGVTVASSGSVSGNGALIKNGAGTLEISGVAAHTGGTFVNGGTLALDGDNTYTGGNTVNAGATLQVAKDAALGDASNGVALNDGTLHATGSFNTARSLALDGIARVNVDGNNVVASTGTVSGGGALIKDGTGTLVLGGTLSQAGGNTVNKGTLILGGNNSYTGGNVVNAGGTLQVAKDAALGAASNGVVLNGGTLATTASFDTARNVTLASNSSINIADGTTLTENGQFSGNGRLYKDGSGTLVLTGDNIAWTGGTTIDAGLVKVTSSTGIGTGDVVLNGGIIQTMVTLTTGQKINVGGNTKIYTDTGTTTTLTGSMDSTELAGSADGCFIKSGKGTLNMMGNATLRNGTCVQEGMLRANGVLNSVVTVDEGAYLRGSGLVTGPISVSGTLAPGNSPGTLTVSSTVTMNPGSTFQADINGLGTSSGPGNYSRLLITGAGNQYLANGATLAPNLVNITGADTYTPYVPKLGDSFRIVTAEGGIVGRFAPLAQPQGLADGTRMAVFYNVANSNSIDLRVVPVSYASYFASSLNSNTASTARVMDRMMALNEAGTANNAQSILAYGVAGVSASQLPNLANALAGQVHGALAAVAPLAGQSLQGTVARQLSGAALSDVTAQEALWADLSGNRGRWSSDAQASGFTANRTQLTVGADIVKNGATRFGAGLSHAQSNVSASAGSGSVEQNLAFVYGEQAVGGVKLDALAGIGRSSWDSQRADPFQIAGVLENNAKGSDALVSLGVRAPWQLHGFALEPFARVMWQRSRRDGFQENTATPAALQLSDYSANGTRMLVGVAGGSQVRDPLAAKATVRYSVGVGRDSGNLAQAAVSASLAGMGTSIVSPDVGRSFVQASVEGTAKLGKGAYAYYGLNGEARSGKNDVGVTGGVRISF